MRCTLVVLCMVLSYAACDRHYHFCIDGIVTRNNKACLEPDGKLCCRSFSYLLNERNGTLPASSEIRIISNTHLSETIYFKNLQDITLVGENITVVCNQKDSGLVFVNVTSLEVKNITFEYCGSLQNSTTFDTHLKNRTQKFRSSLYILNSTNVFIGNVNVSHSNGTGLAIFDTNGTVIVSHSNFEYNRVPESEFSLYPGGGGVYVEFTYCTPGLFENCSHSKSDNYNSSYTFQSCTFTNNNATNNISNKDSIHYTSSKFQGLGRGGGLCIIIKGNTTGLELNVSNCTFSRNVAVWGGGLFVELRDSPKNIQASFSKCLLTENHSNNNGGGSLVEYNYKKSSSVNNQLNFSNSIFDNNSAKKSGGGLQIFSSPGFQVNSKENYLEFRNCSWKKNRAKSGSAVYIAPREWDYLDIASGVFLQPIFFNCSFIANCNLNDTKYIDKRDSVKNNSTGVGVILINYFLVSFEATTVFEKNIGSALYLSTSVAVFKSHSSTTFKGNVAKNGGALAVVGFSFIYLETNTTLSFIENFAQYRGGAVYVYQGDKHDHVVTTSCFIKFSLLSCPSCSVSNRNVTFYFSDNHTPTGDGHAIFATSLKSCFYGCSAQSDFLNCIGTLHGQTDGVDHYGHNVTTFLSTVEYDNSFPSDFIVPGKEYKIPITASDELSNPTNFSHITVVKNPDMMFDLTSVNSFKMYGKHDDSSEVVLESTFMPISVQFNVTMGRCPPGFIRGTFKNKTHCISGEDKNFGLLDCDVNTLQAHILYGYWIGFCNNETICTAYCPWGFCSYNNSNKSVNLLPSESSKLDSFLCGPNRAGVVCGSCRSNHSAFYNTYEYKCGATTHLCRFGILFYILLELLPLTLIFAVVIVFNIDFASGSATGFILFAQLLDSLSLDANGTIRFPSVIVLLSKGYKFIYGILRLEFGISMLSFCLWENATVLDVMAMKYVTILYSLSLVFLTVLMMKTHTCIRLCSCLRIRTLKSAVIHGLTAFFVMCYSQCARVSTHILEPAYLYSEGPRFFDAVLFRNGNVHVFDSHHLPYAIPALFFIVVIVLLPPLLLLLYPLSCKVLSVCHLNETRLVNSLSRLIPMQLLDAFQGCYRDNCRFVAGLYFVYRNFPFALYAFTHSLSQFYIQVEILLVIALTFHAVLQPYKKRCHNIVDSLLFANLAIINAITLYNFTRDDYSDTLNDKLHIAITSSLQLFLIYLLFILMTIYIIVKVIKRWCRTELSKTESSNGEDFPPLRSPSEMHGAINYHSLDQSS